jgi:organic radical activating enzyme
MDRPTEFDAVTVVEFEPASGCTRRCRFCDPGVPRHRRDTPVTLDLGVLSKVCQELVSWKFNGIICLAGHGEPLMHPNTKEVIRICKTVGVDVHLYTNGDLLSPDRYADIEDVDVIQYDQYSKNDTTIGPLLSSRLKNKVSLRPQYAAHVQARFNSRCGAVWIPTKEQLERVKYTGCQCIQTKICMASDGTWYCCCMDIRHTHQWPGGLFDLFRNEEYLEMRRELRKNGPPDMPRKKFKVCKLCETTDI